MTTNGRPKSNVGKADDRHGFDFLVGRWRVQNRRLTNPLSEDAAGWVEFEATLENRQFLGGLGNVDAFSAPSIPGRPPLDGMAIRLFEPTSGLWRIWWVSTLNPGVLDEPVVGMFVGGLGRFESRDMLGGRDTLVRYEWIHSTEASPQWQQSFSFDDGVTWQLNWTMHLTRLD